MTARPKVLPLPAQVANQIAAGEVVTRPASVVKELIENAIDAQASRVTVTIDGGGLTSLSVRDDGHGMDREDAVIALERHATSKIRRAEDLESIASFGFRGEALPSIASVSRLTIRTRPADHDEGTEVIVDGGAAPRVAPCGCAPGTSIEVADLFYNVPARRKFLRALSTEAAHVGEVVRASALAHPAVGFELIRDGRRSRRFLPVATAVERARAVLEGYELVHCEGARGPARIEAYLSGAARSRTGAGGLHLFVLGRPVQDRALARAVASAYGDALEPGRFPVGAVFIDLPRDLVDVNVHPQKAEVRFAHARAVADALYSVVRDAFTPRSGGAPKPAAAWRAKPDEAGSWQWREPLPDLGPSRPRPPETPLETSAEARAPSGAMSGMPSAEARAPSGAMSGMPSADTSAPLGETSAMPCAPSAPAGAIRFIGVARGALLLCETEAGLLVVPRRRAQARLLAHRAALELASGRLVSQRLLFPIVRSLEEPQCDALESRADAAARWGAELRRVGPRSIAIHALPRLFAAAAHEPLVSAIIAAVLGESDAIEPLALLATPASGEDDRRLIDALASAGMLAAAAARAIGWRELGPDD